MSFKIHNMDVINYFHQHVQNNDERINANEDQLSAFVICAGSEKSRIK